MKQTAVEFLEKEITQIMYYLEEDGDYALKGAKDKLFGEKNIIQKAKEIEKQQKYTEEDMFKVWLRCRVNSDEQQLSYELFKNLINSINTHAEENINSLNQD